MLNKKLAIASVILLLISFVAVAESAAPVTAILGAFGAEVDALKGMVASPHEQVVLGVKFTCGTINGRNIVLAQTGMGKVNAAMTAGITLVQFHPTEVIFSGIAGGINPDLQPGDLVIGEKVAQHDYGYCGPDGFRNEPTHNYSTDAPNPMFFESDKALEANAEAVAAKIELSKVAGKDGPRAPKLRKGVIATGDAFIASSAKKKELIEKFKADAVEMEGAAIAQVCFQLHVPFIIIRSISDNADEDAHIDIASFYKIAAQNSAKFVAALAGTLVK